MPLDDGGERLVQHDGVELLPNLSTSGMLYIGVIGSNCAISQIRRCAAESGTFAGRSPATSRGRCSCAAADARGERGDRRRLENVAHGHRDVEVLAGPRGDLRGDQRVSADVEQRLGRADALIPTTSAKIAARSDSRPGAGATYSATACTTGSGSATRSSLPFTLSGSRSR